MSEEEAFFDDFAVSLADGLSNAMFDELEAAVAAMSASDLAESAFS
jgi:hypothetical protein